MSRPHTMFIQNQALPWRDGVLTGQRGPLPARQLSRDDDTGALTAMVRYPAGWTLRAPHAVAAEEEFFVIDGELQVNDHRYGRMSYGRVPAGAARARMQAASDTTVLVMVNGSDRETADVVEMELPAPITPLAEGLETWTENPYTRYLLGTGVRPLKEDADTGEVTFLYSALPFRYMAKRWTHPVVQEMFVLSGEYAINDVGLMCPGAYAWWRENEWHGPYGSTTGFMMLIRSQGGPLANTLGEEAIAVDYRPSYRPALPAELQPYANAAPIGATLY